MPRSGATVLNVCASNAVRSMEWAIAWRRVGCAVNGEIVLNSTCMKVSDGFTLLWVFGSDDVALSVDRLNPDGCATIWLLLPRPATHFDGSDMFDTVTDVRVPGVPHQRGLRTNTAVPADTKCNTYG